MHTVILARRSLLPMFIEKMLRTVYGSASHMRPRLFRLSVCILLGCTCLVAQSKDTAPQLQRCDDIEDLAAIDARNLLNAERTIITVFASSDGELQYSGAKCVAFQTKADGSGFLLTFRGNGVNLTFTFDTHGTIQKVQGNDNDQFRTLKESASTAKTTIELEDLLESLKQDKKDQNSDAFGELWAFLAKQGLDKLSQDPQDVLLSWIELQQKLSLFGPRAETFAIHNKYIANIPVQLVLLSPAQATAEQKGTHSDYAEDFEDLDREALDSRANPGRSRVFPSGTRMAPILDCAEAGLPHSRENANHGLDPSTLFAHVVRSVLSHPVPLAYTSVKSGRSTVLVELDDGRFAMVAEGELLDKNILEPYHFEKLPVPLTLEERRFIGTLDAFQSALPGFVAKAARAAGLDPHNYDRETAYILKAVDTCAKITPKIAAGVTDRYGRENLLKLGEEYEPCQLSRVIVSAKVKAWTLEKERGIVLSIRPSGLSYKDAPSGLNVVIEFTWLKGDPPVRGTTALGGLFELYGIVSAKIEGDQ